jgi:HTH-type transcriptional regulator, competence development regulator
MPSLGELIKNKREAAGLSLKRLGIACGVSDTEIMKIENGIRKSPNWNILCEISQTLDFHPFELLLAAGYITENDIHPNLQIHGLEKLSADDVKMVQSFIDFLAMRSGMNIVSKE